MQLRRVAVQMALAIAVFATGCEKLSGLSDLQEGEPAPGAGGTQDSGAGGAAGTGGTAGTGGMAGTGGSAGSGGTSGDGGTSGGAGSGGFAGSGGWDGGAGNAGDGGSAGSMVDAGPDSPVSSYTLSVPSSLRVVRGSSASLVVGITRDPGFTATVDLSLAPGLPTGITGDTAAIADPDTTGTIHVSADALATLGHATVEVHSSDGTNAFNQSFDLLVADPAGTLDETFNGVGIATPPGTGTAYALAFQPDGKIVVAGTDSGGHWALGRFLDDGTLDASFGTAGMVSTTRTGELNGVAVQPNGRIVAVGRATSENQLGLMRVTATGALDTTFGANGVAVLDPAQASQSSGAAVQLQSDGKIVVAGSVSGNRATVFRFTSGGSLDSSFNSTGSTSTTGGTSSSFSAVTIQSDGAIVAAGTKTNSSPDILVMRFDKNGVADSALGGSAGKSIDVNGPDYGYGVTLEAGGNIVVVGSGAGAGMSRYVVLRLLSSGETDTGFATSGRLVGQFPGTQESFLRAVMMQPDQMIVAVGYGNAGSQAHWPGAFMRLGQSGSLDTTFGSSGLFLLTPGSPPPPVINHLMYAGGIDSDGRIVATGKRSTSGWVVVRVWN